MMAILTGVRWLPHCNFANLCCLVTKIFFGMVRTEDFGSFFFFFPEGCLKTLLLMAFAEIFDYQAGLYN